MSGVNKVIVLGRLGQDPEMRVTQSNQQVCTLSVATSEAWNKDGKKEERTEWHRVVLWGKQAELAAKYLKKGRNVYIEGRLQTRSWDDASGQKRYSTEIIANQMVFVDGGGNRADSDDNAPSYGSPEQSGGYESSGGRASSFSSPTLSPSMDDDVPF